MGRDERDVIVVERDGGGFKWLLLGAAVGAGLALLFAPKTGKQMRRELGRGIRGIKDLADETLDELKQEFGSDEESDLRSMADAGGVHEEAEEAEAAVPAARVSRPRMVGAREELERRLEAARARRRDPGPDDEEPVA